MFVQDNDYWWRRASEPGGRNADIGSSSIRTNVDACSGLFIHYFQRQSYEGSDAARAVLNRGRTKPVSPLSARELPVPSTKLGSFKSTVNSTQDCHTSPMSSYKVKPAHGTFLCCSFL